MVKRGWDVTTAEGREALERFLMERMGFEWDGRHYWRWGGLALPEGWIFTGDGMVWAKEWAHEKGLTISSWLDDNGACAEAGHSDPFGWNSFTVEAVDEPTAVALALARALEEMEGVEAR